MKKLYKIFRSDVRDVTRYYMILVEETRSQRLVGSTNEWVLDNYYMVSEQEKVMGEELKSVERGDWRLERPRMEMLCNLLDSYLEKSHCEVDKSLLFRYLRQVQQRSKDYLSYPEVTALLPIMKLLLIGKLASLCRELEKSGAQHYRPTEKPTEEGLETATRQNLRMMNIFNSLKKMTKLPMAELIEGVSFSEKALRGEQSGMYDRMQDKTKDDYRAQVVRLSRKRKVKEYAIVTEDQPVTVRDKVAYEKVDVSGEIKKESEVNVAKEDTAKHDTVVESKIVDTVEWVESTKTEVPDESGAAGSEPTYTEVDRSKIADPYASASVSGKAVVFPVVVYTEILTHANHISYLNVTIICTTAKIIKTLPLALNHVWMVIHKL